MAAALPWKDEAALTTERLPCTTWHPTQARLLFPDCLLPFLRADSENNALLVRRSRNWSPVCAAT